MNTIFECSQIAGIAAAVPGNAIPLSQFTKQWGEKEVANVIASTGITQIRQAPAGMTASDLCQSAAQRLLHALNFPAGDIDGIVFVSQTSDYIMPATSAVLQNRLGLDSRVAAFDINYGCSGYVYGLLQADMLIHAGMCRSVLVLAGDTTTQLVNPRDRALRMLFGDGGSATLVVAGSEQHSYAVRTDGSGAKSLIVPAGGARNPRDCTSYIEIETEDGNARSAENLFMDGVAVLFMALRDAPAMISEAISLAHWSAEKATFYGLHQANRFMVDYLTRKMRIAPEATAFSCADIGNTGPASIPVMLAIEHPRLQAEGRLEKSVLCGFGVGFSTAATALPLNNTTFLPLVELG